MRVSLQQQRNPHPNAPRTFLPLAPRTPAAPARRHSRRRQPRCAPSGLGTAAGRCAAWDSPTSSALPVSPRDALGTAPSGQPHPPHRRRCPGQPRNAPRSAHLPPRQCRATARGAACKLSSSPGLRAVRCGAERPAPELCSRRSPAAATRGGGRGGSTGTASFSSGRPPPSAEPRGASGGYGAGRGGAVRGGRRGGGGGCTCGSGQRRGMAAVGISTSSRPTRSSASPRVCLPATGVHTLRVDAHGSYLPACLCAPWKLTPAHVRSCTPRGHTCVHARTAVPLGITDHPPAGHPHAPAAAVLLSAPTRTHKHVQQTLPLAVHPNPRASHTLHSFCSFSQTHLSHPGAQRVDGSSSGMAAGC